MMWSGVVSGGFLIGLVVVIGDKITFTTIAVSGMYNGWSNSTIMIRLNKSYK